MRVEDGRFYLGGDDHKGAVSEAAARDCASALGQDESSCGMRDRS